MFFRGTLLFNFEGATPPAGFSESWEYEAGTEQQGVDRLNSIASRRAEVLSEDWTIIGQRVTRADLEGSIIKYSLVMTPTCAGTYDGKLGDSDSPWAAVLVKINKQRDELVASARPRMYQMRGIPDSWWANQGVAMPAADKAAFATFMKSVTQPGLQVGQLAVSAAPAIVLQRYNGYCPPKPSNRKIGRPFGLHRGRRSCPTSETPSEA